MIKDITFSSVSNVPSDYACPDGQLAAAQGFVPSLTGLVPAESPLPKATIHGGRLALIHRTSSGGDRYICIGDPAGTDTYVYDVPADRFLGGIPITLHPSGNHDVYRPIARVTGLKRIVPCGNVLTFLCAFGIEYSIFRDGAYFWLGPLPEAPAIEFALRQPAQSAISEATQRVEIAPELATRLKIQTGLLQSGNANEHHGSQADRIAAWQSVMLSVNLARAANEKAGLFTMPFFVRYALRLYDGSNILPSSPVLMLPSVHPPVVTLCSQTVYASPGSRPRPSAESHTAQPPSIGDDGSIIVSSTFNATNLRYRVLSAVSPDWADIITGIDIFVSPPVFTYDQNPGSASIDAMTYAETIGTPAAAQSGHGRPKNNITSPSRCLSGNFAVTGVDSYGEQIIDSFSADPYFIRIPYNKNFENDLLSACNFYLLASLDFDELTPSATFSDLVVEDSSTDAIVTRQRLDCDNASLHRAIFNSADPVAAIEYNHRLHVVRTLEAPLDIPSLRSLFQFSGSGQNVVQNTSDIELWLDTKRGGSRSLLHYTFTSLKPELSLSSCFPRWLFIPDAAATSLTIKQDLNVWSIPLSPHDFLDGAYYYGGINAVSWPPASVGGDVPPGPYASCIHMPHRIMVSQADNPFLFSSSVSAGSLSSRIIGLAAATKALSQGQFGQFPLYAFTDQGVWSLQVDSTGTYSSSWPVSRDVCIRPDAITQLDGSVLFPTVRGIMEISGSTTRCISDALDTDTPFSIESLPRALDILHIQEGGGLSGSVSFSEFLSRCGMVYDYRHQRVVLYSHDADGIPLQYAYVYSIPTNSWGQIPSDILHAINAYPQGWIQSSDGVVASLDEGSVPADHQLLVTRPFKLGAPDSLKTIDTLIVRGDFSRGHVSTLLYGSRDLRHWHLVRTSVDHTLRGFRGTPYKYFRLVLPTSLSQGESLTGATVSFTPRLNNRLR